MTPHLVPALLKSQTKNRNLSILTAAEGDGQQCKAAPACTASIELVANGSLEISALTNIKFLQKEKLELVKILRLNLRRNNIHFEECIYTKKN